MESDTSKRAVTARGAGSLVLIEPAAGAPQRARVLMGRRAPASRFIPNAYVFPGGSVGSGDRTAAPGRPLDPEVAAKLPGNPRRAHGFAMAAVRETFEETALAVDGGNGGIGGAGPGDPGFSPALDVLEFIGRAITPKASPMRFDTCFFAAPAGHASGVLEGNGELLDLRWIAIEDALALATLRITRLVLDTVARMLAQGHHLGPGFCPRPPHYVWRNGGWTVRHR